MRLRVYELWWNEETIEKLWAKHRVEPWEVEDVVFDDPDAEFWWAADRKHGKRLMVVGQTRGGRRLRVVLNPVSRRQGTWRPRTAWEREDR